MTGSTSLPEISFHLLLEETDSEGTEVEAAKVFLGEEDSGSQQASLPRTALQTVVPRIQVLMSQGISRIGGPQSHTVADGPGDTKQAPWRRPPGHGVEEEAEN